MWKNHAYHERVGGSLFLGGGGAVGEGGGNKAFTSNFRDNSPLKSRFRHFRLADRVIDQRAAPKGPSYTQEPLPPSPPRPQGAAAHTLRSWKQGQNMKWLIEVCIHSAVSRDKLITPPPPPFTRYGPRNKGITWLIDNGTYQRATEPAQSMVSRDKLFPRKARWLILY